MMRYFNTYGPVEASQHYVVSRQELIDHLITQVEAGQYFTIFAPRQMGKTTLLRKLDETLTAHPEYLPIALSFERYEKWSEERFLQHFGKLIIYYLTEAFQRLGYPLSDQLQTLLKRFSLAERRKR